MKRKWWIPVAAIIPVLLLSLSFEGIRVRIMPRLILSRALGNALEQLEERFEHSPMHLIADAMDPTGRQQASLELETEQDLLGIVRYDMLLHTQLNPCRVLAEGTVVTGGNALDLSLYLDGDFAAVSSEKLVEGSCYGIQYDTFSENIRSRQILAALIGEKTISQWEQSVADLDTAMSRDFRFPEIRKDDLVAALYGVTTLKPQVSRVETPAGASRYAYAVTFCATGQELAELAGPYRNQMTPALVSLLNELKSDETASVEVMFLLHNGDLAEIHLLTKTQTNQTHIFATLGTNPKSQQLAMDITTGSGESHSYTRLEIDTVSDTESYQEKLRISQRKNKEHSVFLLEYDYDLSTGEMDVCIIRNEKTAQAQLHLSGEGDTLTVISHNASSLLNLFLKKPLEHPAICTLTVSPGREVAVPEYRDLDQWSVDDLLSLLSSLGGLLGLKAS